MSFSNSKCGKKDEEYKRIDPPKNKKLPFFTYGFFKPHQLAYPQIKKYVKGEPKHSLVKGKLKQINGIPVLLKTKTEYNAVEGYIIEFKKEFRYDAYREIGYTKSKGIYKWEEMDIEGEKANVLVATKDYLFKGDGNWYNNYDFNETEHYREKELYVKSYDWKKDPMFEKPPAYIKKLLSRDRPTQSREEDYEKFLDLQMFYMLLWSCIDRFLSLRYGEIKKNNVISLSEEKSFRKALKKYAKNKETVYSTRDLKYYELNPEKPACSAMFYYTIRNNVVHSGKTLVMDQELLLESLKQLLNIFSEVVEAAKEE